MKKAISIITILTLIIGLNVSCKKKPVEFDIDYTNTVTIPATAISVNVPADFDSPEISTDSKSKFSSQKTAQELVEEIKMTKFDLSVANGNLNFLKSLSIYLKTSDLGDILIATKQSFPENVSTVGMDLQNVNIKQYIFKDKIQFRVNVTIKTGMTETQQLKMDQTVHVKASLTR